MRKMFKKLLWMAVVTSCITAEGYCFNSRMLRIEAESCLSQISSGGMSKQLIKESLGFLSDSDIGSVAKKYTQGDFEDFYQKTLKNKRGDEKLDQFAQSCKELYDEEQENARTQIAVRMLLEKVSEKYLQILDRVRKADEFKKTEQQFKSKEDSDLSQQIKTFINADKEVGKL